MRNHDCVASRKVTGTFHCDLSRTDDEKSMYSARFRVAICVECGRAELYCDPDGAVCEWLDGKSDTPKPRVN
jgi:hypothetical protein